MPTYINGPLFREQAKTTRDGNVVKIACTDAKAAEQLSGMSNLGHYLRHLKETHLSFENDWVWLIWPEVIKSEEV